MFMTFSESNLFLLFICSFGSSLVPSWFPLGSLLVSSWSLAARSGPALNSLEEEEKEKHKKQEEREPQSWAKFTHVASRVVEHQPELAKALDNIANIFLFEDDSAFKNILHPALHRREQLR